MDSKFSTISEPDAEMLELLDGLSLEEFLELNSLEDESPHNTAALLDAEADFDAVSEEMDAAAAIRAYARYEGITDAKMSSRANPEGLLDSKVDGIIEVWEAVENQGSENIHKVLEEPEHVQIEAQHKQKMSKSSVRNRTRPRASSRAASTATNKPADVLQTGIDRSADPRNDFTVLDKVSVQPLPEDAASFGTPVSTNKKNSSSTRTRRPRPTASDMLKAIGEDAPSLDSHNIVSGSSKRNLHQKTVDGRAKPFLNPSSSSTKAARVRSPAPENMSMEELLDALEEEDEEDSLGPTGTSVSGDDSDAEGAAESDKEERVVKKRRAPAPAPAASTGASAPTTKARPSPSPTPEKLSAVDGAESLETVPVCKLSLAEAEAMAVAVEEAAAAMPFKKPTAKRRSAAAKAKPRVPTREKAALASAVAHYAHTVVPSPSPSPAKNSSTTKPKGAPPAETEAQTKAPRKAFSVEEEALEEEIASTPRSQLTADEECLLHHETLSAAEFSAYEDRLGLVPAWRPMISFLVKGLGCSMKDLEKVNDRRDLVFGVRVERARSRCVFLTQVGLSLEEVRKVLVTHPRLLEYRIERTMQNRIDFLKELGVPGEDIAKVIGRAPGLFAHSVDKTLRPRVDYLVNEVGLDPSTLGTVVARHPQMLTNSVEEMMAPKIKFLQGLGVSREGIIKMVTRHPQILQYKIESMLPRLQYLQSIGMDEEDITLCVSRLSQIFSLSVERSLQPKFEYLTKHLGGNARSVTSYPAYFSLSLDRRIKPRHMLLKKMKKAPMPFPMKYFSMTDKAFVSNVAGCTMEEFEEFRDRLLLEEFNRKNAIR